MTDDTESFFNAWKTGFGISEKILFCTWHVDRIWRLSISRLITKKEIQVEAYKIVRSLLEETDEVAFDIILKEALKLFDEKDDMKEFKGYFEQSYIQCNMCKHIHFICSKNLNEINSTMQEERLSLDSRIIDDEMVICEDRKVLEKEAHVDNLRATSAWTEICKKEFQKNAYN
ncbi:hypothetical protein TNCV_4127911 [Trichonephila clavipes]|uniref:MULE transposase domain-containing protein n=1 Tax=Trichonephila clavipes TaxID=2585209 RepID=A0A8X6VRP2_TRICX|nr:hypothetical protein TNCV_4127911 [Trichonephila clavipes]